MTPAIPPPSEAEAPEEDRSPDGRRRLPWIAGAAVLAAAMVATVVAIAVQHADGARLAAPTNSHGQFVGAAATAWSAHPVVTDSNGTEVHIVAGSPTCIDDWRGGASGSYSFDVLNNEGDDMEVYLQDTSTKQIALEVENFGISATRRVTGVVQPGSYQWVCITAYTIKSSAPFRVTGSTPAHPVPGVVPVTPLTLRVPINTYTAWVQSRLPHLTTQVKRLAADLRTGETDAAKRDWLAAHLTYETLGAAYGAFGELDTAVNGAAVGDVDPIRDPKLTGFRKIEALLWSGAPSSAIARYGDKLVADIGKLPAQLALPNAVTPIDMGNRAHEILEDTLGSDLNSLGDAGSRTELATVDANITGTFAALKPLDPILSKQDPWLAETTSRLHELQKQVEKYRTASGWKPLSSLTRLQRADINARVQDAVELLSHIPPIVEPRDNPDEEGGVGLVSGGDTGGTGK